MKKEVAERPNRDAFPDERRRRENQGAEEGDRERVANRLGGLGERRELPQWGPGQSPGRKRIWCILWPLEGR